MEDIIVTDENKDDILGETDGEAASVTFDPDSNTLTLDHASFATGISGIIMWTNNSTIDNLTIRAIGDNCLSRIGSLSNGSIIRTLTFTGPGTITLTGTKAQIDPYSHPGLLNLVFDGVTFSVEAGQNVDAIKGNNVTIKNGANVTALSLSAYNNAIYAAGQINISDSAVTVSATRDWIYYALYSASSISVTGNTEVIVDGGVNASSFTIVPGDSGLFEVFAGNSEEDATAVTGSPFEGSRETSDVHLYNYFHIRPHEHTPVRTEAKEPTCTEAGNIEYWYCPDCGKYFSDETLTQEITKEDTVIPAKCSTSTGTTSSGTTSSNTTSSNPTVSRTTSSSTTTTGKTASPQTGDSSNIMLRVVLLIISCGGLAILFPLNRERKRILPYEEKVSEIV